MLSFAAVVCSVLVLITACPAHGKTPTHVLAFGDSLTAGYGLAPSESFAARLEARLLEQGYQVRVTNAGVSGDTTSGGLDRLPWSLEDRPQLVILELGANDGLRGMDVGRMRENLESMIRLCQEAGAAVLLTGMRAPVNWGDVYKKNFEAVYPELAQTFDLSLYPFFLDGVLGKRALMLTDGLHPNAQGVERIVDGILPFVLHELNALPTP